MNEMVVGFVFDKERKNVLLIEKKRPSWQVGYLNGIGGHIEHNESPHQAMVREFEEEAGIVISQFKNFVILNGSGQRIYFFLAFEEYEILSNLQSPTDEELKLVNLKQLNFLKTLYNLKWMTLIAFDEDLITPIIVYDKTKYINGIKEIIWD